MFFLLGIAVVSSCASKSNQTTSPVNIDDTIVSSIPPFKTKEPARYQAVRTFTFIDPAGNSTTTKMAIARFDALRRQETQSTGSQRIVFLDSEKGRLVLLPESKIYSEVDRSSDTAAFEQEIDSSPERLLHQEKWGTTYQKLGNETVANRSTTKYRLTVNTTGTANVSSSETVLWIDETLGMPVKSETKASDGSRVLMELSDIAVEADKRIFEVPEDYKKVALDDLRLQLRKN